MVWFTFSESTTLTEHRLQMTYRASTSSHVSQFNLYTSYKTRFDPCAAQTNLLGGQELIQLACATFPGCEMARDEGDYVLRGIKERGEGIGEHGVWDTGVDKLVEPIRAGTWSVGRSCTPVSCL